MKKYLWIVLIISFLLLSLFFVRLFNQKQIDDISSEIPCEMKYVEKADVLWVIPDFEGKPISENKELCDYILSLNKTLGLHGVYHTYWEFKETRNQEYLEKGISEFEKCFGYKPKRFKAPNLRLNKENRELLKENNLTLSTQFDQVIHKVYHCNNSGTLDNKFHDIF